MEQVACRGYLGATDYLRTLAISRIALDNFRNIQASWVTQGKAVGQMTLPAPPLMGTAQRQLPSMSSTIASLPFVALGAFGNAERRFFTVSRETAVRVGRLERFLPVRSSSSTTGTRLVKARIVYQSQVTPRETTSTT